MYVYTCTCIINIVRNKLFNLDSNLGKKNTKRRRECLLPIHHCPQLYAHSKSASPFGGSSANANKTTWTKLKIEFREGFFFSFPLPTPKPMFSEGLHLGKGDGNIFEVVNLYGESVELDVEGYGEGGVLRVGYRACFWCTSTIVSPLPNVEAKYSEHQSRRGWSCGESHTDWSCMKQGDEE